MVIKGFFRWFSATAMCERAMMVEAGTAFA